MNTVLLCERTATAISATAKAMPTTNQGNTLDLPVRPMPKAVRTLWTYRDRTAYQRPSRGPVYRWYPISWMTPVGALAASLGMGDLLVGEQLGDPVGALVQPVQRQVQRGDGADDGVVGLVGLQRYQQHPPVPLRGQAGGGQPGGELVGALVDLDGQDVALHG